MARRIVCFICCLTAGLSGFLCAQTLEDRIIFVPPVSGFGLDSSDAGWFTELARMEIPARGFSVSETTEGSQYTLAGSLDLDVDDPELISLRLTLILNETGNPIVEQELVYASQEEASEWFSVILFTMLANIPAAGIIMPEQTPVVEVEYVAVRTPPDRTWQNKWLYLGACLEWDHRRYLHGDASSFKDGIGGRLFLEFQFLNFMSVETGAEAARDEPRYDGEALKVYMLEGFAVLKVVLKPSSYCMFEPYGGISVNFPLSPEIEIPQLSWVAGLQLGVKLGPGSLFVDISYSQDFANAVIKDMDFSFQRQQINLGIGYKLGFFNRPASNKEAAP